MPVGITISGSGTAVGVDVGIVVGIVVGAGAVVLTTVDVVGEVDGEPAQATSVNTKTHKTPPGREGPRYDRVEVRGIEPLASTVRLLRSAN